MSIIRIPYRETELEVNINLMNCRYVNFQVNDDMTIDMKVPIGMKYDMIEKYAELNRGMIIEEYERKLNRNHQSLPITLELEEGKILYHNGLRLPFLGNMKLRLCIKHVAYGEETQIYEEKDIVGGRVLTIRTDNDDQDFLRYCVMRYYKKCASKIVKKKVEEFAQKMELRYNKVHITNMSAGSFFHLPRFRYSNLEMKNQMTLWGRCTRRRNLKFDWKLAMLPMEVIEYIIVHELTHIKKMNHSSSFWYEIEKVMPEYRECRSWLDKHGKEYEIF